MPVEVFIKEPSKRTPGIVIKPGKIFIMGRSIPDNPAEFYEPVLELLNGYDIEPVGKTRVDLGFEYINTSSTKWILFILRRLSELKNLSRDLSVNWYYESGDEDMNELGKMFQSFMECPFLISPVTKMNQDLYSDIKAIEQ